VIAQVDLAAVYEAYYSKIYNYVFYKILHKQITEDLVSMIFLKVAEKYNTYDSDKGAVSTWLYTIAQNTLNDYFRTRHIPVCLDEIAGDLLVSVDFEEQSRLIQDETRRELYMALSTIDNKTRDIISQKYFRQITIREIAKEKNMNESTVSTLHNRGLEKLRKSMPAFML
jgi:RNA polymerase sigma-70 factor (ECF subfamily)